MSRLNFFVIFWIFIFTLRRFVYLQKVCVPSWILKKTLFYTEYFALCRPVCLQVILIFEFLSLYGSFLSKFGSSVTLGCTPIIFGDLFTGLTLFLSSWKRLSSTFWWLVHRFSLVPQFLIKVKFDLFGDLFTGLTLILSLWKRLSLKIVFWWLACSVRNRELYDNYNHNYSINLVNHFSVEKGYRTYI